MIGVRRHYYSISNEERVKILFEVEILKRTMREASISLGLHISSVKNIVVIYRKEGRIEKIDPRE